MRTRSRQEISAIVSASGFIGSIIFQLERERKRRDLPPEVTYQLAREDLEPTQMLERIMDILEGHYFRETVNTVSSADITSEPKLDDEGGGAFVLQDRAMAIAEQVGFSLQLHRPTFPPGEYLNGLRIVENLPKRYRFPTQHHLEALMNYPQAMPEEWQDYSILFLGSAWVTIAKVKYYPLMMFRQGRWVFQHEPLNQDFSENLMIAHAA